MFNLKNSNFVSEDIQMGTPKGKSTIVSANSLRESSMLSKASSIEYTTYIEAQSNNPSWAN